MKRALAPMLALLIAGCGYALEGRGATSDPTVRRIGVPLFKDSTGKAGLDQKITTAVIEELLKRGHFDVVQDESGVDAIVDGTLTNYTSQPVGFGQSVSAGTQATRYAVVLTAKIRYAKPDAPEAIWETEGLTTRDEYDIGDDAGSFFDREDQALDRIAKAFAKTVVNSMLEAF